MQALKKWHQTKLGLAVFGLVELALAYTFASLAINSAHTWQYLLAGVFTIGTLQNVGLLIRNILWHKPNKQN